MATQYQILNPTVLKQYKSGSTTTLADGRVVLKEGVTPISGTYKEIGLTPEAPTSPPTDNTLNSNTLKVGMSSSNVPSILPDNTASDKALQVYNQGILSDASKNSVDMQKQIDELKATALKDAQYREEQANKATADYNANTQPAVDAFKTNLSNQTSAIQSVYTPEYYTSLLNDKKSITDEIIGYSKLLDGDLNNVPTSTLASVATGRRNAVIADYQARINVKQAALSAIDGNFSLASSILDNGISKLDEYYTNQLNFQKLVQNLYQTSDVKDLTEKTIADLEVKQKNLEATKTTIQTMMSNPETALVISKAGILLTDTPDQVATKLSNYYVNNPVENSKDVQFISATKYQDSGFFNKATGVFTPINGAQPTSNQISYAKSVSGKIEDSANKTSEQNIDADMQAIRGNDGYYDTAKYYEVRRSVAVNTSKMLAWFDKTYPAKDVLNPNDPSNPNSKSKGQKTNIELLQENKDAGYSRAEALKAGFTDAEVNQVYGEEAKPWWKFW